MAQRKGRRQFLKTSAAVGVGYWVAGGVSQAQDKAANERIRFACIGIGGKGSSDSGDAARHGDVVAICDTDTTRLKGAEGRFPKAKPFTDYRELFEKMGKEFDAVTVSTPDHNHAAATMLALQSGKHAFTQKPLTHSIYEARMLGKVASENKLVTQMGNQGTANSNLRKSAAIIKSGALGKVKEVHVWTNRPVWPQGADRPQPKDYALGVMLEITKLAPDAEKPTIAADGVRKKGAADKAGLEAGDVITHFDGDAVENIDALADAVSQKDPGDTVKLTYDRKGDSKTTEITIQPDFLAWESWIGPADKRRFAPGYHPFSWRGWWDFGTGALGDMACHTFNMPFMALNLRDPDSVEAQTSGHNKDSYPKWSVITFQFPVLGERDAVKVVWYDGGKRPDPGLFDGKGVSNTGSLIIGEKGKLHSEGDYGGGYKMIGAEEAEVEFVQSPGHFTEFAEAIKGGPEPVSNFPNYAGPLTETILLGNLAVFAAPEGKPNKVMWDAKNMKVTNDMVEGASPEELAAIVKHEYREGWSL